ncbi:hypothetical protein [Magnetospirillum sp. SS-4]|uniref:hypothetical protein n=1 Tax=Magnetospirillum sp. SS-4 TaxID=2681465 RepID=UPI00137C460E|nr:hypothetical protein [Magnetospirillum sp. SS-4]CAA7612788.1 conserved hypothetical protein [Magnetospirillum sp. SS-4]
MSGFEAVAIPMAIGVAKEAISSQRRQGAAKAAADAQNQAAEQHNQIIAAQQAQEEKRQRNLLARQQASVTARMSAWGVGGGGSADAILQGMARQTAESLAENAQTTALRRPAGRKSLLDDGGADMVGQGLDVFTSFYRGM